MPPKKQKKVQSLELKEDGENSVQREDQASRGQGGSKFGCVCGKKYGSLAAVHTHINNKHNETIEMKKEYKRKIENPKKVGQPATTSIRMKDILYKEDEAELMCLADKTLKKIYDKIQETPEIKNSSILIDINEELEDSDSEIDQYLEDLLESPDSKMKEEKKEKRVSNRTLRINEKIEEQIHNQKLEEIKRFVEGAPELQSFKLQKFTLSVIRELSKFFKEDFAVLVELSLQLIHSSLKAQESSEVELSRFLNGELQRIWREFNCPGIAGILTDYFKEWKQIRYQFANWKKSRGDNSM